MIWQNKKLGLIFRSTRTKSKPVVKASVYSEEKLSRSYLESLKKELVWRYNLELDLSEFYSAVKDDKILTPVIKRFYGLRPMSPGSLYEYLVIGIMLQNCTVRRSVSMLQSLFENYGDEVEFDNKKFWCFWKPEKLAKANEKYLRSLKLGYRAQSLIRVSTSFSRKEIDEIQLRKTNDAKIQKEKLLSLYGIGPATVGYIMEDVFHQFDFMDHISPWEQKIYTRLFFNKDYERSTVPTDRMLKFFDRRWKRWKRLAIHYAWEDLWWKRRNEHIPWLEKLIRL